MYPGFDSDGIQENSDINIILDPLSNASYMTSLFGEKEQHK